jgi:hypothetical protein
VIVEGLTRSGEVDTGMRVPTEGTECETGEIRGEHPETEGAGIAWYSYSVFRGLDPAREKTCNTT